MKHLIVLILLGMTLCLYGCRSEADRMAEFCMHFESATQDTDGCAVMAERLVALLDDNQTYLKDTSVCEKPKACDSCKRGVHKMLRLCGHDDALKPVLSRMHFSTTLREQTSE